MATRTWTWVDHAQHAHAAANAAANVHGAPPMQAGHAPPPAVPIPAYRSPGADVGPQARGHRHEPSLPPGCSPYFWTGWHVSTGCLPSFRRRCQCVPFCRVPRFRCTRSPPAAFPVSGATVLPPAAFPVTAAYRGSRPASLAGSDSQHLPPPSTGVSVSDGASGLRGSEVTSASRRSAPKRKERDEEHYGEGGQSDARSFLQQAMHTAVSRSLVHLIFPLMSVGRAWSTTRSRHASSKGSSG